MPIHDWWGKIISLTFHPIQVPELVIRDLYEHFNTKNAYHLFADAEQSIKTLRQRGINVGILSNSDPRMRNVLTDLGITKYLSNSQKICLSYEIGHEKPEVEAFRAAHRQMLNDDSIDGCWHVGDDKAKDFYGAVNAGWNSILLTRTGAIQDEYVFSPEDVTVEKDLNITKIHVKDLRSLEYIFD
jgi:HAD superfamily hydrolase (TIGR01549 family)